MQTESTPLQYTDLDAVKKSPIDVCMGEVYEAMELVVDWVMMLAHRSRDITGR